MTSPYMKDLPEELLEHILRQVKATTPTNNFLNCLRTCRQWHRIGLGLYDGLGFAASAIIESDTRRCNIEEESIHSNTPLRTDFEFRPPSELYLSLLRCLTIHVRHQKIATPFAPFPGGDLVRSLQKIFKVTTRLSTFSLKFSDGWDFPNLDVPAIPQSLIAKLVAVLPDTIISLELDSSGTDVPPTTELIEQNLEDHLCYQLSRIITRLRQLRLRVGHVCAALLAFRSDIHRCNHAEGCEYCITNDQATCTLLRTWKMRSMTVWLPWGQNAENNTLVQASKALLNQSLRNPTTILLVHQENRWPPGRISITEPSYDVYDNFHWSPQSNVSAALRKRLEYFDFKDVSGMAEPLYRRRVAMQRTDVRRCREHQMLLFTSRRTFLLSPSIGARPEPGSTSPYPCMAEQTVENMLCWTQNSHLGYSFPISEADESWKAFWKGQKLWACRFPGCKERCETLVHLRGHHMYAHPEQPHEENWEGYDPCPRLGCDRIGANGFTDNKEMEEHLLGHHLEPCTLMEEAGGSSVSAKP